MTVLVTEARGFMRTVFAVSALMLTVFFPFICFASGDLCKEYALRKEYDRAIEECTKQIKGEIAVKYLEYSYSNRGAAYANKKQYDEAISDYSRAIELNPGYATAYYNRAIAYANKRLYGKAISDFSRVVELNPGDSAAYTGRATAYANRKQYDPAISDYTKAIELNPDDYTAYYNRSMVYADEKQYGPAVADCAKATELLARATGGTGQSSFECLKTVPVPIGAVNGVYHVQLGVFRNKKNAAALVKKFRRKGYDVFVIKGFSRSNETFYRVLTGRFKDRRKAGKLADEIRRKGKFTPAVFSE